MASSITLPFTDEFTALDTELYDITENGNCQIDVTGGYLRIRDTVGGSGSNSGVLSLPFSAFDDQDIFNRVLDIRTRIEYANASDTNYYMALRGASSRVCNLARYQNAGTFIDALLWNPTVNSNTHVRRDVSPGSIPTQFRLIWNGSREHVRIGVTGRWIEPGRVALYFSPNDGSTWSLVSLQRPGWDLRPNDGHGQTSCIALVAATFTTWPTYEIRYSWFKLQELTVLNGGLADTADSTKKAWVYSEATASSISKVSEDGGENWATIAGSSNSILGGNRNAHWAGDMQGVIVRQPFASGLRHMVYQSRWDHLAVATLGGGVGVWSYGAVQAGDNQQNTFGRDRVGFVAFAATDGAGALRVEYSYRGFYTTFTAVTGSLGSRNCECIWFFSPTLFYVGGTTGAGGALWKYTGSWSTVVSVGGGTSVRAIHAFDEDTICCTMYNTANLHEWNGSSWTARALPNGGHRPLDVWGVTEADGEKYWYCVANTGAAPTIIYRKKPGDATWVQYGPTLTGPVNNLAQVHPFGDGSILVASGSGVSGPSKVWRLASSGGSWVEEESQSGYDQYNALHGTQLGDQLPPTVQNQDPAPGAPTGDDSTIVLEIIDVGSGLNTSSVVLALKPDNGTKTTVWSSETQQGGATVTTQSITDGLRYTITTPSGLRASATQYVYVVAYDNNDNLLDTFYSFGVGEPPQISLRTPTPDSTSVDSNAAISFRLTDDIGVVPGGVNIYIRREDEDDFTQIFNGGSLSFSAGWDGSYEANDQNGYDFTITPGPSKTYQSLETITVKVEADD